MEPLHLLEDKARAIAREVKTKLPPNVGFTLLLFDYEQHGNLTYISSADRGDMLRLLDEFRILMNQS